MKPVFVPLVSSVIWPLLSNLKVGVKPKLRSILNRDKLDLLQGYPQHQVMIDEVLVLRILAILL